MSQSPLALAAHKHRDLIPASRLPKDGGLLGQRLEQKYPDRITGSVFVAAREGKYAPLPPDLPPGLNHALRTRGMVQLYSHQAAAWDAVQRGENIVVVTPTASGRSLCYTLPVVAAAGTRRPHAL